MLEYIQREMEIDPHKFLLSEYNYHKAMLDYRIKAILAHGDLEYALQGYALVYWQTEALYSEIE